MMSDDDDIDPLSANQSAGNLAKLFQISEPAPMAANVPVKQPKKDSSPKVMTAVVVQAFFFSADQNWVQRGKMGAAILSTENTMFQLILYLTQNQQITSARINATSVFTCQTNKYLSFQDDGGQNWSIMFDSKQALVDFVLQIVVAKAYLLSFKFGQIIQDIREGEGSVLIENDSVEVTVNKYKFNENGTVSSVDTGEIKPTRFKIGKQQNDKTFTDSLRGMKKNGQRIIMIGTTIYNIEIIRVRSVKRDKEARTGSITMPIEEPPIIEPKRSNTDELEANNKQSKMRSHLEKIGVKTMFPHANTTSAFSVPLQPSHIPSLSDEEQINTELLQQPVPPRPVPTTALSPTAQYVLPMYGHHSHQSASQLLTQQPNLYPPQPSLQDYNSRPGSSMSAMPYPQVSMWPTSYHHNTQNVPPTDPFNQQQLFQNDFRQLLNRLTEKVDLLNEKFDAKNSTSYPNMDTNILLNNIQRIVKENDNMKKDLFDRSAKVEELNLKISELLDRNQKLIEQTHQTAAQRNDVVNTVSEQTAQKILDLEKQKVELTNNLSISTSKIAELQLQINKYTQDTNEVQSRVNTLVHQCEQYRGDAEKSESRRLEVQSKFDSIQEQLKHEKATRKQLQTNQNILEEELAEVKATCANLEKLNNERKTKFDNERKRWQDDIDEQKQSYEKELDELRTKLRKQRTTDNQTNNQEITRIEQDLEREWQEKIDRQQAQHERVLTSKIKEVEQLRILINEYETKSQAANEERKESQKQIETYEEQCNKLQGRLTLMKEKIIEMNEEQSEAIQEQVKRTINIIFQRLKIRIQPTKQYTGEQFLSRSLDIIKKATLKVLSNNDGDDVENEQSTDEIESADETEQNSTTNANHEIDQPLNGNSVDQQTLTEEISSIENPSEKIDIQQSETSTTITNNQKNGWDTVDDFQQESKPQSEVIEQSQTVLETEGIASTDNETEMASSNSMIEVNEIVSSDEATNEEHSNEHINKEVEKNDKELSSDIEMSQEPVSSDNEDTKETFQTTGASISSSTSVTTKLAPSKYTFNESIPLMTNPDDSEDEMFK